jgi:hypothetical protein
VNAQEKTNNKIPNDSTIINSVPYKMWFYEYVNLRKDSNFKKELIKKTELKDLYDSADKYYKLYSRHNYYAAADLLVGQAGVFIFSNNYAILSPFILPSYILVGYLFYLTSRNFVIEYKLFKFAKLLIENSNYKIKKEEWVVTKIDKKRYIKYKKLNIK